MNAAVDFAEMAQVLDLTNIVIHDEQGKILDWTRDASAFTAGAATKRLEAILHELLKTCYPLPRDEIIARCAKAEAGRAS